jgi:tight adherence protein C
MTVDTILSRMVWWGLLLSPLMLLLLLQGTVLVALLLLLIPPIMPLLRLLGAQRRRRERIDGDLPDFLDVLAVTVTAGVAFRPGLGRVAEQFGGPVAEEVRLALAQLANGASLRQAFTDMRSRTGSDAMAQFVTAFLQSEELGVPLADTLNQIAVEMRGSAAQLARRRAAKAVPRVTLVTSIIFVPGIMAVVATGIVLGSGIDFGELFCSLGGG